MVVKNRVIYTQGEVAISGVVGVTFETAQNATFTLTVPRENVNAMGYEGTVDRPQLDATDATLEFAFIPAKAGTSTDLTGPDLGSLMADSLLADPARSQVWCAGVGMLGKDGTPAVDGGPQNSALLNSISVDAAVGAMPTTTLGWTGVAEAIPSVVAPGDASTLTVSLVEPKDIVLDSATFGQGQPAAPSNDGNLTPNEGCAQSGAVAWDLPVEVILCLSDDPADEGKAFGNPPGTASFTVESLKNEIDASERARNYTLVIGDFGYTLSKARIDSKTNSMAVGDLFGTFNYVLGGTADGMVCA